MELLKNLCEENGILLKEEVLPLFDRYRELLKKWGRRINLTSILENREIVIKHFFDSLLGVKAFKVLGLPLEEKSFCDIGSGAGFPGVPLSIVLQNPTFTLVESRHKRCVFLEFVKRELNLKNVRVLCKRIEEVEESFDYLLMRAVEEPQEAVSLTRKFLDKGAVLCIYRGREPFKGEIKGYKVKEVKVDVKGVNFERRFLFIEKDNG